MVVRAEDYHWSNAAAHRLGREDRLLTKARGERDDVREQAISAWAWVKRFTTCSGACLTHVQRTPPRAGSVTRPISLRAGR